LGKGAGLAFLVAFFAALLALLALGRRLARRRACDDPGATPGVGVGVADGAVFALIGLLIAFSFSGAATRFDQRRELIVAEANAVGTAWLRLDLLDAASRAALREDFRRYVDARLAAYRAAADERAALALLDAAGKVQGEIWTRAVAASEGSQSARMLLLPALNEMFDIATARTNATRTHPPPVILGLLVAFPLLGALLAGYGMVGLDRRTWLHAIVLAGTAALAVYVILDLEYPRTGLIVVEEFDRVLIELRKTME